MDDTVDRFGPGANYYKGRTPYTSELFERLAQELRLRNDSDHVLDLACGCGEIAFGLSPFVEHIVATDKSDAMLEIASVGSPQNIEFVQHDLNASPFYGRNAFRLVTMGRAIPYFRPDLLKQTLNKALNEGGAVATCGAGLAANTPWLRAYQNIRSRFTGKRHRLDFQGIDKMRSIGFKPKGAVDSSVERVLRLDDILAHALSFPTQSETILARLEEFTSALQRDLAPFRQSDDTFLAFENSWAVIFE